MDAIALSFLIVRFSMDGSDGPRRARVTPMGVTHRPATRALRWAEVTLGMLPSNPDCRQPYFGQASAVRRVLPSGTYSHDDVGVTGRRPFWEDVMRTRVRFLIPALIAIAIVSPARAQSPPPSETSVSSPAPTFDVSAARSVCEETGGQVQERTAAWNTNGEPSTWLMLAGRIELCRYQTQMEGVDPESRLHVDLRTLVATEPTLAAIAYLSKVPVQPTTDGSNPASAHCTRLGGTSQFGEGAAGGGWVSQDDPIDVVVAMCVFADGSMIDEWGITYYAEDAIRGIDLAPILGYQPGDQLPPIFGRD
jgi:putative hemolysin